MPNPLSAAHPVLAASVLDPLYKALAAVLAFFYGLIPNYAVAIALLTVAVMVVLSPLTWKSTRSMISMQRLQPEMKKLQAKYKGDRQRLNEEMMALYKEHNVNPMSGCLPVVLQFPVFFVLYRVIANLTHGVKVTAQNASTLNAPIGTTVCQPEHIPHNTHLYQDIVASGNATGCHMTSFGIDLGKSATTAHGTAVIAYWVLVALVVVTQYIQTRQLNGRNPQAAANPQAKMMQRVMPVVFGFISISIAAGVNVYFFVSSLFRIAQQEGMYRWDPQLSAHAKSARTATIDVPSREAKPKADGGQGPPRGLLARLLGYTGAAGGGGGGRPPRPDTIKGTGRGPAGGGPAAPKGAAGGAGGKQAGGGGQPTGKRGGDQEPPRQSGLARLLGLAPPAGSAGGTPPPPAKPTPPSTNGRGGQPPKAGGRPAQPGRNKSRSKRSRKGR